MGGWLVCWLVGSTQPTNYSTTEPPIHPRVSRRRRKFRAAPRTPPHTQLDPALLESDNRRLTHAERVDRMSAARMISPRWFLLSAASIASIAAGSSLAAQAPGFH